MVRPSADRMTLAEFLAWDDGTDVRYELYEGVVVAMAPPTRRHGRIQANLVAALSPQVKPPCSLEMEVGIVADHLSASYYQVDAAIDCSGEPSGEARQLPEPRVVIEILSESTVYRDTMTKVPEYQRIPSILEIVMISSLEPRVVVHRRRGDGWIIEAHERTDDVLHVESVEAQVPLSSLFEGVAFNDVT